MTRQKMIALLVDVMAIQLPKQLSALEMNFRYLYQDIND